MNIIVCIKQVPDTTEVRVNEDTGTLIRDGVKSIINPDDKAGIEVALTIKDVLQEDFAELGYKEEKVKITVLSMGPMQATEAIKEAIAMGCDDGILLSDRAFGGADTWATSQTIAAALKKLDYDLIITGRQAIDGDTAQVGPQIAEHLGLPQVTYVKDLELKQNSDGSKTLKLTRAFEDANYILEVNTPCLISTMKEMNSPRYMSIAGIMDSFKTEVPVWDLEKIKDTIDMNNIGLKGSPTRVVKSKTRVIKATGQMVNCSQLPLKEDDATQILINKLTDLELI